MKQMRNVLHLLVVATMLLLAACGAGPTAPAADAPAAEAPAADVAATEAPAADAAPAAEASVPGAYGDMPADAIAFPLPPELDLGGATVEPLPIDQIVTYKALDKYNEPEWVTALVEAGSLPPVAE
ncbi:MAG: hypothetical protein M3Q45_07815, partial [Chloroflexota bacterium]|nr:hypothetical protein [Chloroflexota bacterium]